MYWLMFLTPAVLALAGTAKPLPVSKKFDLTWLAAFVFLAILIGLRDDVGGDWEHYAADYKRVVGETLEDVFDSVSAASDPGYILLNWLSAQVNGGVYLVNMICGTLLSAGLVAFCRQQPRPWLALAVATPYLLIVVGMGYTRQGVALGLAMLGLSWIARGKIALFVLCIAIAGTIHKSAVVLIPLAVLASPRGKFWTTLWVGISAVVLYYLLLAENVERLVINYIEAEYQSEGAAIRVAMNAVPAALLLLFRRRFEWKAEERNLWVLISSLALVTVAWLFVAASSTAVDRLALYLIPLQLYVFVRLPDVLGRASGRQTWILLVLIYYALVQYVWLNFAANARHWLPYQSWLL